MAALDRVQNFGPAFALARPIVPSRRVVNIFVLLIAIHGMQFDCIGNLDVVLFGAGFKFAIHFGLELVASCV